MNEPKHWKEWCDSRPSAASLQAELAREYERIHEKYPPTPRHKESSVPLLIAIAAGLLVCLAAPNQPALIVVASICAGTLAGKFA